LNQAGESLHQAQRERLAYIELRVFFMGELRRVDLEHRFSIKPAAASRDLNAYKQLAPDNLVYDASQKTYRPGDNFNPVFGFSPERTLTWLMHGFGDELDLRLHKSVPSDSAQFLINPDFLVVARLTRAIHAGCAVEIEYLSLNSGSSTREIVPVALADNGQRWHVRAFDRRNQRFGDFVMTRIVRVSPLAAPPAAHECLATDQEWNALLPLQIAPHPGVRYPDAVIADYAMHGGELNLIVRAALAGYTLNRWRVDCSADHHLDPAIHHLWLKNRVMLEGVASAVLAPGYSEDSKP
jgi:hypothetical protein